ncbi:MAG: Sensor histidine kinase RcsC [Turneriella sp.]|nr:Sensor histidine kinase RcsC [Turneriella sp.]
MKKFIAKISRAQTYREFSQVIFRYCRTKFSLEEVAIADAMGLWHYATEDKVLTHIKGFFCLHKHSRIALRIQGNKKKAKEFISQIYPALCLKLDALDTAAKLKRLSLLAESQDKLAKRRYTLMKAKEKQKFEKKLDLFGKYSHDLKTPFSTLIASLEHLVLSDDEIPARLRLRLDTIRTAIYSTLRTAGQTLDAARLMTKKRRATLVPYNFSTFVTQIVELYTIIFESYGLALKQEITPDIPAEFDPVQMEKILNNLLNNAIKHNIPGGMALVSLAVKGNRIELKIQDTGLGQMPNTEKVKDRRPWNFSSHGYGLEIVRELVKANRGRFRFESERGVGTSVTVSLPAAQYLVSVVASLRRHNFQTTLHEVELLSSERTRLSRRHGL